MATPPQPNPDLSGLPPGVAVFLQQMNQQIAAERAAREELQGELRSEKKHVAALQRKYEKQLEQERRKVEQERAEKVGLKRKVEELSKVSMTMMIMEYLHCGAGWLEN